MEPASIRTKNPGAMWGSALAKKWGSTETIGLNDGLGQGNNIAVFPTYVHGICAQLDLWRTSKYYRNKRFADAIAKWAGGNEVPSYIAFVKKRVPGLTEDTILNDDFWQSDSGIAFLKAQAWHEAGKKYPAPDGDWIEARRIVFNESPAAAPPQPVKPATPALDILVIKAYQQQLQRLGYTEVGKIDGLMGDRTYAAITAFQLVEDLPRPTPPELPSFDPVTVARLAVAGPRPISDERASTSAKDLIAAGHETVTQAAGVKKVVDVALTGTTLLGGAAAATDGQSVAPASSLLDTAPAALQRAADGAQTAAQSAGILWRMFGPMLLWIMAHPVYVVLAIVIVALVLIRSGAVKTMTAAVERYRTGADTGETVGG